MVDTLSFLLSALRCPPSAVRPPPSAIRSPLSTVRHPLSTARHPYACIPNQETLPLHCVSQRHIRLYSTEPKCRRTHRLLIRKSMHMGGWVEGRERGKRKREEKEGRTNLRYCSWTSQQAVLILRMQE